MSEFKFACTPQNVVSVNSKFRNIQSPFPHPETMRILDDLGAYESRSMHGQMPVVWERAKDFQVFDPWGNSWIDFTSTIFVANAGHANPAIKKALLDTIHQDLLHSYSYPTKIRGRILKKLIEMTQPQFEKAYLMSSGTEATECLIKLIRLHGKKIGKAKPGIISFLGAYHGRTIGAAMIGGTPQSQEWIGYKDPNIYQFPFPYPWDIEGKNPETFFNDQVKELEDKGINLKTDICGFILEPYIGWAATFIPQEYIRALSQFAKDNDILLSFDEIQGGFGRTGKLFVYEHYGVKPDLIACGKGISSSLPLSAVLGPRDIMDLPEVGSMSSTHSANPLSCAAGLANLEYIIDHNLVEVAHQKGNILHKRLNEIQEKSEGYIRMVTGAGLLAALIFENPETKRAEKFIPSLICERAMQSGLLLIHTGRESIKIAPPLTISEEALMEGLEVLETSVFSILHAQKRKQAS